ncbi:MAG: MFS transporter [Planctomycetia bacterium]|nr:MFS transporter [Planctomycetia bacterium]
MDSTTAALHADEPPHPTHLPVRLIAAGTVGNIMEWYDFAVYGYFAATIGKHFFPANDPTTSLIAAFGVFAAGFLMRPLGGVVFGHIGDRIGRKAALTLSVLAMAIPTFLIGVLPGHDTLGALAAVLLVILRMIQGLSVGGEYTTSIVFLVEGAGRKHRGFAGSWSGFGAVGGILLGSAVGAVIALAFPPDAVQSWAWRLPFLVGLFVGLAGLFIRRHIPEAHKPAGVQHGRSPVWEALRSEWRTILRIALLNAINGVGFYVAFVYLVTYMQTVGGLSEASALEINTLNMVVLLAVLPSAGWLSDRLGRKPLLVAGIGGLLVLAWPLFWALHHPSASWNFVGQLGFAVCFGLFGGVIPVTMVETTPAGLRCSAISIGYNLCVGLLGGLSPLVATWLIERTQDDLSPAYYVMAAALISLLATLWLPETADTAA